MILGNEWRTKNRRTIRRLSTNLLSRSEPASTRSGHYQPELELEGHKNHTSHSSSGTSSNSFLIHNLNFSSPSFTTSSRFTYPILTYPLNSSPKQSPGNSITPVDSCKLLHNATASTSFPSRSNLTKAVVPATGLTHEQYSSCLITNLSNSARLLFASPIFLPSSA